MNTYLEEYICESMGNHNFFHPSLSSSKVQLIIRNSEKFTGRPASSGIGI